MSTCKDCKWWVQIAEIATYCGLVSDEPEAKSQAHAYELIGGKRAVLGTGPDFGCNQFEQKSGG